METPRVNKISEELTILVADDEVDRFLARFAHEPTVREVQDAAIKFYNVSPSTISSG